MGRKTKRIKILSILLFLFFALVLIFFISTALKDIVASNPEKISSDASYFHVIDVEQGESILFEEGSYTMLIDGGNRGDEVKILDYLKGLGIKKIDFLIATHPHADHIGGLPGIITEMEIGSVYMPDFVSTSRTFENLLEAIENKNLEIEIPSPGDTITMKNASATFLGPTKKYDDANNSSIVLKITHGQSSFLTTGDIEKVAEKDLLKSGADLRSTLLSVGHHGSSTSNTEEFIYAVSPDIAVISCGKDNSYGHPHKEVLSLLHDFGSLIYRTDESSTVVFISDGSEIRLFEDKENRIDDQTKSPPVKTTEGRGDKEYVYSENITYIGNKRSKVMHLGSCNFLPAPQNQVEFKTRSEAIELGYTPCPNCNP